MPANSLTFSACTQCARRYRCHIPDRAYWHALVYLFRSNPADFLAQEKIIRLAFIEEVMRSNECVVRSAVNGADSHDTVTDRRTNRATHYLAAFSIQRKLAITLFATKVKLNIPKQNRRF